MSVSAIATLITLADEANRERLYKLLQVHDGGESLQSFFDRNKMTEEKHRLLDVRDGKVLERLWW